VTVGGDGLPLDVSAALGAIGEQALAWTAIGTSAARRPGRATYRVELASGRVVKVRRTGDARRVARAAAILEAVGDPRMPWPLLVSGGVTVDAWVEGSPNARPAQGGDLLGSLHAVESRPRSTAMHAGLVGRYLDGRLSRAAARRLVASVERGLPARADWGITHRDLCGDNLVVAADGGVVAIDNENVRRGHLDFDVARSWYRWSLSGRGQTDFLRAYGAWRDPARDPREVHAWRITAVARSVHVRRRSAAASATPLLVLERLLDDRP
jgi:hypothetical protein